MVAAVFAKLNEVRLAKGGAPLGFLNPFIYKNAAGFNDVTQVCGVFFKKCRSHCQKYRMYVYSLKITSQWYVHHGFVGLVFSVCALGSVVKDEV